MYFITQRVGYFLLFSTLSRLRMFALMSDAVYRSRHSSSGYYAIGLNLSIPVRIYFKGRPMLTHRVRGILAS